MTANTYLLVVLSAALHAWWNFLLKRSGGMQAVVGLSKLVETAVFLPLLITGIGVRTERLGELWILPVAGAGLVLANYFFLAAAYRHGDLSMVYPIARGAMLMFLPPLAYVTLGERLTSVGIVALILILAGVTMLNLRGLSRSIVSPATVFALLAALAAAGYTIWDKRAVQMLTPMTYFAAYTVITGAVYAALLPRIGRLSAVWRKHWPVIVLVGLFNSASYLLTLAALQNGQSSYVIAVRQLSIAGGALLGWRFLGESLPLSRVAGLIMLVGGCVLMALVR